MIVTQHSKDGKFYFTIVAKNKKVLATSETYNSKQGMLKGIKSLINRILYEYSEPQSIPVKL